ncbi:efflux RND transporter periplasmic adaptor subunit [Marinobacter sp. SS21]|uniref:efflux RND transporter periplasmic adaptor subunit n=1 Tax=Marinobacter sp. SS21 TaxID=2979460 RepID=UPI00233042A6|nr:efflux RND transporter periplasmic adaptor subunit [Marinobacter sp. SS21]MDC0664293.1 efflux RND transporter periplasmic adaptor subunit [Marinobacter sp. SS21]
MMRRKFLWVLVGIAIVIPIGAVVIGTKIYQFQAMAEAGAQFVIPPEPVNVMAAREVEWHPRISSVGSITAVRGTVIGTEAEGVVSRINFQPGSQVEQGDVLVQLDTRVEEAQLRSAQVAAQWARVRYNRARELSKTRHISDAEMDSASNELQQTEAEVRYLQAVMDRKTIRAPFAGKLGILEISVGNFLDKGSPVVSLQALDPVFVEFSLPQQHLGIIGEGLNVLVRTDSYPDHGFEGKITAINPAVDPSTRNVRLQATLNNPAGQLRPGMFVSLDLKLAQSRRALLIPATAVHYGPRGNSVFVVEEEQGEENAESMVVRQRTVKLGDRMGDFVIVEEGIGSGDQVVSTGVFKLRTGMSVVIDNRLAPEFSLAPRPDNS